MSETKKVFVAELNDRSEYQRLLDDKSQSFGMKAGRVHLKPGEDCTQHSTGGREELLVFLSGSGQLLIGEKQDSKLSVGRGQVAYIPPDTIHNVKNTGLEPLIYVYCVAPAK